MGDYFEIDVRYNEKNISFQGKLLQYGYSHKILVSVNGQDILFEPDEERNYRAVLDNPQREESKIALDIGLLRAIAEMIESVVK